MNQLILFLLYASSLFMTGVIWIIQVVHYPSFYFIDKSKQAEFHKFHVKRITPIVAPWMLLEAFSGIYLFLKNEDWIYKWDISLLALIWTSTFLFSVPLHEKLSLQQSETLLRKLILTNWPRTLAWTLKSLLLTSFMLKL